MDNLLFGFWNFEPKLNAEFREGLHGLYRQLPRHSAQQAGLLIDDDVDQLMQRASAVVGAEWFCLLAVGLVFWDRDAFVDAIHATLRPLKERVLVLGQLINKKGYYCGIHEQMFIVHLPTYRRLGMPKFGGYESSSKRLQNYIPGKSLHDDYTPSCLMPLNHFGKDLIERKTWTCGWSFVDASMRGGMRILNLPGGVRAQKTYIYPGAELDKLNKNLSLLYKQEDITNSEQRRLLTVLFNRRLRFGVSPAGNSLQIYPGKGKWTLLDSAAALAQVNKRVAADSVDCYVGPCSGLLDVVSLYANGIHPRSKLVYYAANAKAIEYKKLMFERFDGHISALRETREKSLAALGPDSCAKLAMEKSLTYLDEVFSGEKNLMRFWQQLRQLPREFVQVNLLSETDVLMRRIDPAQNTLFVIDQIFNGSNEVVYGQAALRAQQNALLSQCKPLNNLRLLQTNL